MVPRSPLCLFRQVICHAVVCLVSSTLLIAASPTVTKDARHDTSPPLRDIASLTKGSGGVDREATYPRETNSERKSGVADPVAQELTSPLTGA